MKWTSVDWLWLIILFLVVRWLAIGVAKIGDFLAKSILSLEQKISDLEWTINDQKGKIESMTKTLHQQKLMLQNRPK